MKKHITIAQASKDLARKGVKHTLVLASGRIKYNDTKESFAESFIASLKERVGDANTSAIIQGQLLEFILPYFKQFNGKVMTKVYLKKLQAGLEKTTIKGFKNIIIYSSKVSNGFTFYGYVGEGANSHRSEYTFYYKVTDGALDYEATLKDNAGNYNNVRNAYKDSLSGVFDEKALKQELLEFYAAGEKLLKHTGRSITSFSGLIDYLHYN